MANSLTGRNSIDQLLRTTHQHHIYLSGMADKKASLVLTSNKSFLDWSEVFGDQVLVTAILDRLLHHSTTINIKGESYRLKEKRKAGLLCHTTRKQAKTTQD